jgi:Reverse transcriptase (RNA-dependent DNA polymerase)
MANVNIKGLPMGLCNSPDIFQENLSNLMDDLEFCRAYLDDILVITKYRWEQHLVHLQTVLTRLQEAGLKVNATKSFFGKSELEYPGFWITRAGIQPLPQKINAILQIDAPATNRNLRWFIGMVIMTCGFGDLTSSHLLANWFLKLSNGHGPMNNKMHLI